MKQQKIIRKADAARPTRRGLLEAMASVGRINLDGFVLNCSKGEHHGSHFVDLSLLVRGNTFAR